MPHRVSMTVSPSRGAFRRTTKGESGAGRSGEQFRQAIEAYASVPVAEGQSRLNEHGLHLGLFLISLFPMNSLFKALSHPVRRRIIAMLRARPLSSGDIAAAFEGELNLRPSDIGAVFVVTLRQA